LKRGEILNYSYERVSTVRQDERRQEISLEAYHIDKRFVDKQSGKNADRPELQKLLDCIVKGDTVIVESISRFARNTKDFLNLMEDLEKKEVEFISKKENIDTSTPTGKFVLTVLAAMAQLEREIIVDRVREGLEKARRYGTRSGKCIGRPPVILPDKFKELYPRMQAGKITKVDAAKELKIGRKTLYRWIEQHEKAG
jgi:DNA invertase Pin-like site-specific DNA recombinase